MLEVLSETQPKGFVAESGIVGWTQGYTSRMVCGEIIGRERRGVVIGKNPGELKIRIQEYIKITGNEGPLSLIPGSRKNTYGWTANEFEITRDVTLETAMNMQHSPSSLTSFEMQPGESTYAPLVGPVEVTA